MNAGYFRPVVCPDEETEQAARARREQLTKPAGSPSRLEEFGIWASACQGECPPCDLDDCRVYVFVGDHDAAQGGVSTYPSEMSIQMPANIEARGAGVNVIADIVGATVTGVDISLDHDTEGPYHIRRSCGSIDREGAVSEEEVDKAIRMGIVIADATVDGGADLLIAGDLGIGNTTPAAALIESVTNPEPVVVVGHGTGIDDEGWKLKIAAVRDTMFRVRCLRSDPTEVLRRISSPDMTAMVALLAQTAVRRIPVISDGVVVILAALLADQLAPDARDQQVAGYKSAEPVHVLALRYLDKELLLEYGIRFDEGSGAVTALPLVKSGVLALRNMATFVDAGVSTKD